MKPQLFFSMSLMITIVPFASIRFTYFGGRFVMLQHHSLPQSESLSPAARRSTWIFLSGFFGHPVHSARASCRIEGGGDAVFWCLIIASPAATSPSILPGYWGKMARFTHSSTLSFWNIGENPLERKETANYDCRGYTLKSAHFTPLKDETLA